MHARGIQGPLPGVRVKPVLRYGFFALAVLVLGIAFRGPLVSLLSLARSADLHSHILLVPFVSAYLLYLRKDELGKPRSSWGLGVLMLLAAACLSFLPAAETSDALAVKIAALVSFVIAACFLCFGSVWVRSALFPLAFLAFLIPIPNHLLAWVEGGLTAGSAGMADWLFKLTGTPVFREGQTLQIPGIVLEVARECSGIRSTLVLFITSLVASQVILRSPWRRTWLVAAVIPLGILRNGLRILVIGLLCVHEGPHMIDSVIHRKGGPVFFAVSLVPLFFLAWWLRRGESRRQQPENSRPSGGEMVASDTTPGTSGA